MYVEEILNSIIPFIGAESHTQFLVHVTAQMPVPKYHFGADCMSVEKGNLSIGAARRTVSMSQKEIISAPITLSKRYWIASL